MMKFRLLRAEESALLTIATTFHKTLCILNQVVFSVKFKTEKLTIPVSVAFTFSGFSYSWIEPCGLTIWDIKNNMLFSADWHRAKTFVFFTIMLFGWVPAALAHPSLLIHPWKHRGSRCDLGHGSDSKVKGQPFGTLRGWWCFSVIKAKA